jgi:hypothetical protein
MEMDMQQYLKNRLQFPMETLAQHAGNWVAWSRDGARIVASSADPETLDNLIRAAGEDPEQCLIEGIPDTDGVIGGLDSP